MKITKIETYETFNSANTFYPWIELKSDGKKDLAADFWIQWIITALDTASGEQANLYYPGKTLELSLTT